MEETSRANPYLVPGSIMVAGVLVAAAVLAANSGMMAGVGTGSGSEVADGAAAFENNNSGAARNIRPVTRDDHIRGNPDARIALIEFSDFECPFCQRFHATMQQVLAAYPDDVKWVYRHFPLTNIHAQAEGAAIASECIAAEGGNEAFWAFTDAVFANQQGLNPVLYRSITGTLGIDLAAFDACVASGRFNERVNADAADAVNSGGGGTPYNVIVTGQGDVFPFSGALPFEDARAPSDVRRLIEQALASIE